MDYLELKEIAVSNLRDACKELCDIAEDGKHMNEQSRQAKDAWTKIQNRFTLCFTLKNVNAEIADSR